MNKHALIYVVLIGLLVLAWFDRQGRRTVIQQNLLQIGMLEKELQEKSILTNNLLVTVKRLKDGSTQVKEHFIPDEGAIVRETDKAGKETIQLKTYGLTLRHGITVSPRDGEAVMGYSPKFAYWGRYSAIGYVDTRVVGFGISRNMSDILSKIRVQNTEFFISKIILDWSGDERSNAWIAGFRLNL